MVTTQLRSSRNREGKQANNDKQYTHEKS